MLELTEVIPKLPNVESKQTVRLVVLSGVHDLKQGQTVDPGAITVSTANLEAVPEVTAEATQEANTVSGLDRLRHTAKTVMMLNVVTHKHRMTSDGKVRGSVAKKAFEEHESQVELGKSKGHTLPGILTYFSSRTQRMFDVNYQALGFWIGGHPVLSVVIGALILISGIPGTFFLKGDAKVIWININTDNFDNFGLSDHRWRKDYDHAIHAHHGKFHPPRRELIIMTPRGRTASSARYSTVLSARFLSDALDLINAVYHNVTYEHGGQIYSFSDVCETHAQQTCMSMATDIFSAIGHSQSRLAEVTSIPDRPLGAHDYWAVLAAQVQGAGVAFGSAYNATGLLQFQLLGSDASLPVTHWSPSALAFSLSVTYSEDSAQINRAFETSLVNFLEGSSYPHSETISVSFSTASSIDSELEAFMIAALPMVFTTGSARYDSKQQAVSKSWSWELGGMRQRAGAGE